MGISDRGKEKGKREGVHSSALSSFIFTYLFVMKQPSSVMVSALLTIKRARVHTYKEL